MKRTRRCSVRRTRCGVRRTLTFGIKMKDTRLCFKQANRNPYFRSRLLFTYSGLCAKCGKSVFNSGTWNAHHTTYDHDCFYNRLLNISCVEYGAIRQRRAPPCHLCAKEHPDKFEQCQHLVVIMCADCHQVNHGYKEDIQSE